MLAAVTTTSGTAMAMNSITKFGMANGSSEWVPGRRRGIKFCMPCVALLVICLQACMPPTSLRATARRRLGWLDGRGRGGAISETVGVSSKWGGASSVGFARGMDDGKVRLVDGTASTAAGT